MNQSDASSADVCCRCGYNLTGISDLQACPECGLLAERSRRVSDELHQTRPRWLRRLSWGVWLILIAILSPIPFGVVAALALNWLNQGYTLAWSRWGRLLFQHLPIFALDLSVAIFSIGVLFLASREGYPPADIADSRLRRCLRGALLGPWAALVLAHTSLYLFLSGVYMDREVGFSSLQLAAIAAATFGCMPLPILLALRLRGLARRARSAHLAEHCIIVGVGVALTLAYIFVVTIVMTYAESWGWGGNWQNRGMPSLLISTMMGAFSMLFVLWALYLMIRFAIAFAVAARNLRRQWRQDDRSVTVGTG